MTDINKSRIRESNKLYDRIKTVENLIQLAENSISNLRCNTSIDNDFKLTKTKKLADTITAYEQELVECADKIETIKRGEYDTVILAEIEENQRVVAEKNEILRNKKLQNKKYKDERKKISQTYYNNMRTAVRKNDYPWQIQKEYDYYMKCCNSIPDYLLKKLKYMPANKGYIWRGVHCYGDKPFIKRQPIVLFEKKNKKLYIHEYVKNKYNLYEKINRDKILLSSTVRNVSKNNIAF